MRARTISHRLSMWLTEGPVRRPPGPVRPVSACPASAAMQPTKALSIRLVSTVVGRTRTRAVVMPGATCTLCYLACEHVHMSVQVGTS